jgi:hypothetical protein
MGTLNFIPSQNGLHYVNHWPDVPDLKIATPFGPVAIGNAANGLCGGMALAARDLFEAHEAPPPSHQNPDPDSQAFTFIVARLFDSFDLPGGVAKYLEWMNIPTHNTWVGPHGTSWRTICDEMPAVRASIDSGHPCPLALVRVHSANPADLGHNHQVLAYGYEDAGPATTVRIYDPNCPNDDGVTITFDTSHPEHTTDFTHSRDASPAILGFFATPYAPRNPAPLFSSTTTWVTHPGAAYDVGACGDSVWVVGTNPQPGGYGIYHWNGGGWDGIDGGAVRIAVAPDGSPWVVNDAGAICHRVGTQWTYPPGAAHDIGVGADGGVWVIGTNPVPGGYGIYHWNGGGWDGIDGGAVRIAVAPDGSPWVVNDAGSIFHREGGQWRQVPGGAHDIGVGADGSVWVIGTDVTPGGYGIYVYAQNAQWDRIDGGATEVAVTGTGMPWVVNSAHSIFERS